MADAIFRLHDPAHSQLFITNLQFPLPRPRQHTLCNATSPTWYLWCIALVVHAQGQQLDAELRYRGHAFAQSTASTYKSQLRAYFRFCLYSGYRPVRCSSHHLLRYVVFFLVWTLATSSIPSCYLNVARIPHLQCMWLSQPSARTALFISKGSSHGGQQAAAQRCCSAKASNYFPVSVQIFHINSMERLASLTPWMQHFGLLVSSPSPPFGSLIYLSRRQARLTLTNTCAYVIFAYVNGAEPAPRSVLVQDDPVS